ncbi:alpha/beta hydrolase [Actinokineospora globicatena]|uniref:Lipase/esterase n=1 Tax=Actinokineospora globicatena TaxID=103729 RepID=A0A9W6VE93_9PSEU|nr:alpha/beta hydrolase [Actinokineospora globicatena]GLW95793.1 putative lipase/esterase [Actinokineospora globicatena]
MLHPQVRAVAKAGGVPPPLTVETLPAARAGFVATTLAEAGPGTPLAAVSYASAGGVPIRLYLPASDSPLPVTVYLHGGGWAMGDLDTHDPLCRYLAALSGAAVVAVDYRLAPEHPFPAAIDDVDTAVTWLRRVGSEIGLDVSRMAIAGDSAGAHLATVAARRARDRGQPFAAQVLVCPITDHTAELSDVDSPGLLPQGLEFCWDAYAPEGVDRDQPDLAPSTADLVGLPPTLVITAEHDILRASGEAYAQALAEAGVPAVAVCYQGMIHGFFRRLARFDAARQAVAQVAANLRAELS